MALRQPPLRLELRADEPDRRYAVLLRGAQEPEPGAVARRLVVEDDLVEARERVAHVRRVVDRQPPLAGRVDVRERAVRELRAGLRIELGHAPMMARARSSGAEGAR